MTRFEMAGYANVVPTTSIDKINGVEVRLANNVIPNAADLADLLPGFFIEKDADGIEKLCIARTQVAKYVITDSNAVDHTAIPFEPVFDGKNELVGGRPPVNR
jgi:hypothetical protein